jgi:formylglycine-generating enzyme required for sulfatase activity
MQNSKTKTIIIVFALYTVFSGYLCFDLLQLGRGFFAPTSTSRCAAEGTSQPTLTIQSMSVTQPSNEISPFILTTASDPLQAALILAQTPVTRNVDWTPFTYVHLDDPIGAETMLVPVGEFIMGSDQGDRDQCPPHAQQMSSPYWIDRTEVTRAQYQTCINAGKCTRGIDNESSTQPDQPMNRVTWFQAIEYCNYRMMRLPTEREWEYAARGPESWIYPWGNDFEANNTVYTENSNNQAALVGSRETGISWIGALDLSGNVWEWTSSVYRDYEYISDDGREDLAARVRFRVLRGGGWNSISFAVDSAVRFPDDPDMSLSTSGFRCARDI